MRIAMFTNVYAPQVGGITRSIQAFSAQFREQGHQVLIIAPRYPDVPKHEENVLRVPAIPHFYEDNYPLPLKLPGYLWNPLHRFRPQIVHAHHPFLLGAAGQLCAATWNVPLVYTHHCRFSRYLDLKQGIFSEQMQSLVDAMARSFCRRSDVVIAPSQSIANMLSKVGVEKHIEIIPTGVDVDRFHHGDGARLRQELGIPPAAFVVGHVGRLSYQKNLGFLAPAAANFLRRHETARFLVVGEGDDEACIDRACRQAGIADRLHRCGFLEKQRLVDAYHAMDVFAFASLSETQGMVLTEAMAAQTPVVALDASGVRDVVRDRENGRLLVEGGQESFVEALTWIAGLAPERRVKMQAACRATAEQFSIRRTSEKALNLYASRIADKASADDKGGVLPILKRAAASQCQQWGHFTHAFGKAIKSTTSPG